MSDRKETPPRDPASDLPDVKGSNPRLPTFEREPPPPPKKED